MAWKEENPKALPYQWGAEWGLCLLVNNHIYECALLSANLGGWWGSRAEEERGLECRRGRKEGQRTPRIRRYVRLDSEKMALPRLEMME